MTDGVLALGEGACALFTSRAHGNLSSVGGEAHEQGSRARAQLGSSLGLEHMVRGYQVHGATVGRVRRDPDEATFRADGHAVAEPGIAAMVLVADCVPVVLAVRGAVAALHAGWRGLAAGVLEEGIRALRDVGGRGPVRAVIGPCAGACCYEVGEDVHAALGQVAGAGPRNIDLRAIARRRLLAAGVAGVDDVRACTICDERFFSYRREGARAGRQAALAWLAHA